MDFSELIQRLEIKTQRLLNFLPETKRLIFKELHKSINNRGTLLYGQRGVGKTTYLLSISEKENLFYVSADESALSVVDFEMFAEEVFRNGYDGIIVDEVHFLKDWSVKIKNLYDSYPDKRFIISDSSSIVLRKGIADLSRRFVKVKMPLMSFREFIYLETGIEIPKIEKPFEFDREYVSYVIKNFNVLKLFNQYSEYGTRPFYKEGNYAERLYNTFEKTVYFDIPYFLENLSENHLRVVKSIFDYLLYSKIPTINVERMCKEWGISRPKLYQLLEVMTQSELIHIVRKRNDRSAFSKGEKILIADPTFYTSFDGDIGNFREAFVFLCLSNYGQVFASDNEEECDFVFGDIKVEVGGRNKKPKKSDFVIRDDFEIPVRNVIPMWLLGMF